MREAIETIDPFIREIGLEKERREMQWPAHATRPKSGICVEWPSCRSDTVMHDPVHIMAKSVF